MILVSGGQLDPNIGRLLRRILKRRIEFRDLLIGPSISPEFSIDLGTRRVVLDGEEINPSACFIRHDVFGPQASKDPSSAVATLNWYHAVRGWAASREDVRCFNRASSGGDGQKIQNLMLARQIGMSVPETLVTNSWCQLPSDKNRLIHKPVAGGEYTGLVSELVASAPEMPGRFPHFVQECLQRPELRVYRIGDQLFGFSLRSDAIDYRTDPGVQITPTDPGDVAEPLIRLCNCLGLDFAAADFMANPKTGEWVFLEVNSQPMFVAFDTILNGRICDAIIDYLV